MKATIFSQEGKSAGDVTLPESVFNVAWNADLVHNVVVGMQANAREGNAHTKDRSEKRGGGRKPWRQKGTGRARHGSRRSPIWTGGGVTFGPRSDKDYSVKINKKVRAKAFAITVSKKFADGEIIFIDSLSMDEPKTKAARAMVDAIAKGADKADLATKRGNAALVILSERNLAVEKSFRNFGNIKVAQAKDVNPVDLLTYKYVVVAEPKAALEIFEHRVGATAPKSN
jgi:large subunit ribosomal protein L4